MATILDGKKVAAERKQGLKSQIESHLSSGKRPAHLVVLLVGDNPASLVYVANKVKACEEVGIKTTKIQLPAEISQVSLEATVSKLVHDELIDGLLVQLPLPEGLDTRKVLDLIPASKDPDFLGSQASSQFYLHQTKAGPCTPLGVIHLLKAYNISLSGLQAVVVGRSHLVGLPMAHLLLRENATVTVLHSRSKDISGVCSRADLVVVAAGKPLLVDETFVREGAIIVDVGIHRDENKKIIGDVQFADCANKASFITPVPGGVGPMTIVTLLENTWELFKARS